MISTIHFYDCVFTVVRESYEGQAMGHAFLLTPLDEEAWLRVCDSLTDIWGVRLYRKNPIFVQFAVYTSSKPKNI